MKFLQSYCEATIAVLNSQFEATKVLRHAVTAGSAREQIIRDFLSAHLPELITVVSGQLVDAQDNYSRQQDVVLVLKSMPRLPFASGSDLIFNEGAVATVEIKTSLAKGTLANIGENVASVRRLAPSIGATAQLGINHSWPHSRILTAVLTYGGIPLDGLVTAFAELPEEGRPDLLLDLSKGLLIRNHGFLLKRETSDEYLVVRDAACGFKLFLTFLTEITGTINSRGVLWRNYW